MPRYPVLMNDNTIRRRPPRLSKSRYTSFLACPRLGYLRAFPARFDSYCTLTPEREALFDSGNRVGRLARNYWPGGLLIEADHTRIPEALRRTREALALRREVIYEAAVEHQGILVRVDILRRLGNGTYELTEVKSGTKVDETKHVPDVAIQLYVLESSGLPVERANLMHLNPDYIHPGGSSHRPLDLFVPEDVTGQARAHIASTLPASLRSIALWLLRDDPPEATVRNSCHDCEYYEGYCRPRCCEFPVTEFGWARQTGPLLQEMGITDILELRKDTLEYARLVGAVRSSAYGPRVLRVVDSVLSGELRIEPELGEILDGLARPLHFLDFESWNPALPVFAGTRPYQQLPFQWSDHCLLVDDVCDHAYHLADGDQDPRFQVAETLVSRFAQDDGAVIAHHAAFECACLNNLAARCPRLELPLLDIASRLVDLEALVADNVYHPQFHGSFSLKAVFPALVPGESYQNLAVQNGNAAALAFGALRIMPDGPEKDRLRNEMLDYCAQDTWAMVQIYRTLRALV